MSYLLNDHTHMRSIGTLEHRMFCGGPLVQLAAASHTRLVRAADVADAVTDVDIGMRAGRSELAHELRGLSWIAESTH